jgi:5-methylcytosine-specific restriction endonuclease McrA
MDAATRALVRRRAGGCCEYCLAPEAHGPATFHIEHIVAKKHRGDSDETNLALACASCNLHKGPNLSGIDPESGTLAPLFHPRHDAWPDHFALRGALISGLTPVGRVTVLVLAMNARRQVEIRTI